MCLLVRWLPPLMVRWCGGPMMCVLILRGGRAGLWAVQYQGWWPRVMRVALSKVLRAHVEMLKCKQIITPEEYRIRFRVLYLIPHELTGFFLKSRRRQSFSVVNTYRMALRLGHVSDAFGIEARSGPTWSMRMVPICLFGRFIQNIFQILKFRAKCVFAFCRTASLEWH